MSVLRRLPRRIGTAISRRLRLVFARVFHPNVRFGAGCDIRSGLHLNVFEGAVVSFGADCILDRDMTIECSEGSKLTIGDRTIFGHHCTIGVKESIVIGEDCLFAEMVSIRDHDHRFDSPSTVIREQGATMAPVTIGRNVWLGTKVTVVKGVAIGDNAVIGANAVVTQDVPSNAVAVGIPARVIRFRHSASAHS